MSLNFGGGFSGKQKVEVDMMHRETLSAVGQDFADEHFPPATAENLKKTFPGLSDASAEELANGLNRKRKVRRGESLTEEEMRAEVRGTFIKAVGRAPNAKEQEAIDKVVAQNMARQKAKEDAIKDANERVDHEIAKKKIGK